MTADLCLVSAVGGSGFMVELLEVVADALRRLGYSARTVEGRYPAPGPNTVYVVVPHEYFVVTPDDELPSPELRERTIGFCVEHPGTATFERTASVLPELGGAVDINHDSTAELQSRGFAVEHFQLGYTPLWDRWGGGLDDDRDIDVTYLGTAERRRSILLSGYWRDLEHLRVRLLTPPHEPMTRTRPDFLPSTAKHAHLAKSRFLLNLHRERSRALEWVRVLEAMCNGCVVVTEPAADLAPVVAGKHLAVARAGSAGAVTAALAADPARERDLRQSAYEFVHERLDLLGSAKMLAELANSLTSRPVSTAPAASREWREPDTAAAPLAVDTPSWDARFAGERSLGQPPSAEAKAQAGQLARRVIAARATARYRWLAPALPRVFNDKPVADVDVLLVHRPGEAQPRQLVNDLLAATVLPANILIAADGVAIGDVSRQVECLHQEAPLGRGYARNRLLTRSSANRVLVLETGMRASRFLLERLTGVAGDIVHCPVGDPVAGLVGALPPELRRLATLPYLGGAYLATRALVDEIGGWAEDPWLDGLEDHVFWCDVASRRRENTLVQQVLLQRRRPDPFPRPLDLAPQHVWDRANTSIG